MSEKSQKIKDFLQTLTNQVSLSDYQVTKKKNDLALVVGNTPSEFIKDANLQDWFMSNDYNFEDALVDAVKQKKNILLLIEHDPRNEFISQIKEYTTRGIITRNDKNAVIDPKNIKIVCLINPKTLNKISYPYFESLFGPVLRLDK